MLLYTNVEGVMMTRMQGKMAHRMDAFQRRMRKRAALLNYFVKYIW